jgi:cobyrinic acid a,c-diamide synthase
MNRIKENFVCHNKNKICFPRILFAAPSSGSGKTMITCGFLEILKRRGMDVVSFKCGPDYIDPMFHQYVLGIPGYNLDSFFLQEEQVRELLADKTRCCDMAVIEGVMGYYDGVAGISTQASAYDIARITDTPVILIVDGKKSSLSIAALVKGFQEYRADSRIAGVILNRTSAMMEKRLRPCIEELGIRCFGSVPECPEAQVESRHLGLTLPTEQEKLREKIQVLADVLEQNLDIDGILELAGRAQNLECSSVQQKNPEEKDHAINYGPVAQLKSGVLQKEGVQRKLDASSKQRIAVARDEAFCFYYQDNLDFLKELGYELEFFSPLHDEKLPEHIHAILFGGGYPECYARELSSNFAMLQAIRFAHRAGIRILAECGGFMYLHQTMEGMEGIRYPMVGIIEADSFRTSKLARFGYVTLKEMKESGENNIESAIRAHEFHYWDSTAPGSDMHASKPLSTRGWDCMYHRDRLLAGFPHLYYRSGPEWIRSFLENEQKGVSSS